MNFAAIDTLIPMGLLYLSGAIIYAMRIPESIWPGKFDIWVILVTLKLLLKWSFMFIVL